MNESAQGRLSKPVVTHKSHLNGVGSTHPGAISFNRFLQKELTGTNCFAFERNQKNNNNNKSHMKSKQLPPRGGYKPQRREQRDKHTFCSLSFSWSQVFRALWTVMCTAYASGLTCFIEHLAFDRRLPPMYLSLHSIHLSASLHLCGFKKERRQKRKGRWGAGRHSFSSAKPWSWIWSGYRAALKSVFWI